MDSTLRDRLTLRRQFILADREIRAASHRSHWKTYRVGAYFLYVHPDLDDLQVASDRLRLTLLGYITDPRQPERRDRDIVESLIGEIRGIDDLVKQTTPYGGRWILLLQHADGVYLFADPAGVRQIHFANTRVPEVMCASQPGTIAEELNLVVDKDAVEGFVQRQVQREPDWWWPHNRSAYKEVNRLIPNHYVHLESKSVQRFWPRTALTPLGLEEGASRCSSLLQGSILAASQRFELALPLTAGWDSRTVLAASRPIRDRIHYYTLIFDAMDRQHRDVVVPSRLLRRLGLEHHVVTCSKEVAPAFKEIYDRNVSFAHPKQAHIAHGIAERVPSARVAIKGHCSEIARCGFYDFGYASDCTEVDGVTPRLSLSAEELARVASMEQEPLAIEGFSEWLPPAQQCEREYGVKMLDLFYWEQRLGSWLATGQLEFDIAQEVFHPFNCRELLESLLSIDIAYRRGPDYVLYRRMVERLWPDVLLEPINPTRKTVGKELKARAISMVKKAHLYDPLRALYRACRG